jgi:hypothetical protein
MIVILYASASAGDKSHPLSATMRTLFIAPPCTQFESPPRALVSGTLHPAEKANIVWSAVPVTVASSQFRSLYHRRQ